MEDKLNLFNELRQKDNALVKACEYLADKRCNNSKGLDCQLKGDGDCVKCWYEYVTKVS